MPLAAANGSSRDTNDNHQLACTDVRTRCIGTHPKVHPLWTQCSDEIVDTYSSASSPFVEERELLLQEHGPVVGQSSAGVGDLADGNDMQKHDRRRILRDLNQSASPTPASLCAGAWYSHAHNQTLNRSQGASPSVQCTYQSALGPGGGNRTASGLVLTSSNRLCMAQKTTTPNHPCSIYFFHLQKKSRTYFFLPRVCIALCVVLLPLGFTQSAFKRWKIQRYQVRSARRQASTNPAHAHGTLCIDENSTPLRAIFQHVHLSKH